MSDPTRNPAVPEGMPHGSSTDSTASELFDAVSGIVGGLRVLRAQAVAVYQPEVEGIIARRSRDIDHIEHTLDGLLSFCGDAAALALFKRLCRYYWDLDPEATARHVLAYRDWFEPEEDGTTGSG
jgi:hypothetical protein